MSMTYPQRFGKYILLNKIALGGMAEIFRAKTIGAEGFEREMVIKRILPHFTEDEAFVNMFIDEATLAAKLSHANIVHIFDFDKVDEMYFIAMEYVEGMDLRRVISRGKEIDLPLSIPLCMWIAIEAAKGLHYAHTRKHKNVPLKIVHRDISPHNIMVSYNGEVKLMDFGIAKAASRSTNTRAGTVKGKCAYMSPEQARGEELDGRSDLFSLAVVIWELLTKVRLFASDSDFEALQKVNTCEIPPPSQHNPEMPEELESILMKALQRDRNDRYEDVGAFVEVLQRFFYATVTDSAHASLVAYMRKLFSPDIEAMETAKAAEATGYSDPIVEALNENPDVAETHSDRTTPLEGTQAINEAPTASVPSNRTQTDPSQLQKTTPEEEARTVTDSSAFQSVATIKAESQRKGGKWRMLLVLGVLVGGAMAAYPFVHDLIFPPDSSQEDGMDNGEGTLVFSHDVPGAIIHVDGQIIDGDRWTAPLGTTIEAVLFKDGIPGSPTTIVLDRENMETTLTWPALIEISIAAPDDVYLEIDGKELGPGMVIYGNAHLNDEILIHAYRKGGKAFSRKLAITRDGQSFVIEAENVPAVRPLAVITLHFRPRDPTVTVDGEPVTLKNGTVNLADRRLGDTIEIRAVKQDYRTYEKTLSVDASPMVQNIKLRKEREEGGFGFVNLDADPWADIYLKGEKLGQTPVRGKRVPAGKLKFVFKNDEKTRSVWITVKRDKTVTRRIQMR